MSTIAKFTENFAENLLNGHVIPDALLTLKALQD